MELVEGLTQLRRHHGPGLGLWPAISAPREGEVVQPGWRRLRVDAPADSGAVEVCFNQGPWLPCRHGQGHWWFDWCARVPGEHEVVARIVHADGSYALSRTVHCVVPE